MSKPLPTHEVPTGELLQYIAGLLAAAPRTMSELQALTGYSSSPIIRRIEALVSTGRARRSLKHRHSGMEYLYHVGAVPAGASALCDPGKQQVGTTQAPLTVRRDPLVAALFGAAGER